MATLDGTPRPVELGQGISLRAPGLRGTAVAHDASGAGPTRAPESASSGPAMSIALERNEVRKIRVITLEAAPVPQPGPAPVRGPGTAEDGVVVDVPDLGPDVAQVLLAVDQAGVVSWNFPAGATGSPAPSRGTGGTVRFVVPATEPLPDEAGGDRALLGAAGRKVFELLTIPLARYAVPPTVRALAAEWEGKARRSRVRGLDVGSQRELSVPDLDDQGWARLAQGRSLWFVHGTFSTAASGFGAISDDVLARLHDAYEGRVVAFDHLTLGVEPAQNAAVLAELAPAGLSLDADIVAHSRGGLVARALAGENGVPSPLRVRRVIHVATPNNGTALADPKNIGTLLNRLTTLLNLAPPGPVDVVAMSLSIVVVVVKLVARFGLPALPGLACMDPSAQQVIDAAHNNSGAVHYAIAADFEPSGALRRLVRESVGDLVLDQVFSKAANDLVVPTEGVYEGSVSAAFPIPRARRLVLPARRGVNHNSYFRQPDVLDAITGWLSA